MTPRERVIRTLEFDKPDRAPRDLWHLAGVAAYRRPELDALLARFPLDFDTPAYTLGPMPRRRGTEAQVGTYIDAWGCIWNVAEPGVCGEVKGPPLADWNALEGFTPPYDMLDGADLSGVNASVRASDRFMRMGGTARLFERLQFLRGTETLLVDLLTQPPELTVLRDMVHAFNLREIELWCRTEVQSIHFMDDWGAQNGLLIDPALWRAFFKPCYRDYCEMAHQAGKYIFFHSDGHIFDIYPDLIEIGVDAVNSQLFCMDIEEIGRRFRGEITFWGEICRQTILPFGRPEEVRQAVWRVRHVLDDGRGGVIAQCEWGNRDPAENIAAVYETWLEPRHAASEA